MEAMDEDRSALATGGVDKFECPLTGLADW